jgi:hypothetical protein
VSDQAEARFIELEALADKYATAQAMAEHLGEFRKSKKALLMKDAEVNGHKTAAIQEREAYAAPEYVKLLEGLRAATEQALSAKWKLEIAKMRFEWARTKAANRRAEMNLR